MGFVSLFGAVSLAFVGHHQYIHSLQGRCGYYRHRTRFHEASPRNNSNQQQPLPSSDGIEKKVDQGLIKAEAARNYRKNDDSEILGVTSAQGRETLTIEKRHQIGLARGVKSAQKRGEYSRYPGVGFHPASGKWQVQFSHKRKRYYGGLHETEEEAAAAHDEFVRKHKMSRPLHFPMEGEPSSLVASKLEGIPIEERQQLSSEVGIQRAIKRGLYTRYPGVNFQRTRTKWQVRFTFKGKQYYGGEFETEKEAALAHDEFVRRHKMNRPLHFPVEGERTTSYTGEDDEWKEQER